jgi:predicted anti-sigma-YlaC factor YlaD
MKDHPSQWIHSGLTCRDVAERATEYLDNHLPILTKVPVGLHLASCADCRAYLKQIALVSEVLGCLPKLYPRTINRLRRHFSALHGCAS